MSYYSRRGYNSYPQAERTDVPSDVLRTRVDSLLSRITRDWDKEFVGSLSEQLGKGKKLSVKQVATLEKIEYRNDPSVVESREQWAKNFTDEMREIAKVCARYYEANPPYFGDLADKVLNQPEFTPTEKQYRAMCENKFAMKVRAATYDAPTFAVGALVALRTSAPFTARNVCSMGSALVLRVNPRPVTSGARGAKTYEILPVGGAKSVFVEERHLKKLRTPKKKK